MSGSINYNKFIKKMKKLGFTGPYAGGKHLFIQKEGLDLAIPNPHHRKDIGAGLLARILKQAKISKRKFDKA